MKLSHSELSKHVKASCEESAWSWFEGKLTSLSQSFDENFLYSALAMVRRKLGDGGLSDDALGYGHISLADAARILLLLSAKSHLGDDFLRVITDAYKFGDEYEKEAILKGMLLLDPQGSLKALSEDACRTNILSMFSAVVFENEYSASFFSEHPYNQMVLKALFMECNVSRMINLDARLNPSLSRMCYDYLRERVAAARQPPASIWLAMKLEDIPEAEALFIRYIHDVDDSQRYYVAKSLQRSGTGSPNLDQAVKAQRMSECVERVKRELMLIDTRIN